MKLNKLLFIFSMAIASTGMAKPVTYASINKIQRAQPKSDLAKLKDYSIDLVSNPTSHPYILAATGIGAGILAYNKSEKFRKLADKFMHKAGHYTEKTWKWFKHNKKAQALAVAAIAGGGYFCWTKRRPANDYESLN